MDNILSDLTEKFESALRNAERKGKKELRSLATFPAFLAYLQGLDSDDLLLLADHARKIKKRKNPRVKAINGDFYGLRSLLVPEELAILERVEQVMKERVQPIVTDAWMKGEFPMVLIDVFRELDICGLSYEGVVQKTRSHLLEGMIGEAIAHTDVSTCTFFGVHSQLAMGSIYLCGSDAQKAEFLPRMQKLELIGAFGLTEPNVGSAASLGLETTCRREGDTWVISGEKKWIGNATFADIIVIWAKDVDSLQVKGFIVDRKTAGLTTEKIEDKMSLRIVQNAHIVLKDVKVPESRRLQKGETFKDTSAVLRMTRAGVAWQAVGCARGAFENTLKYTMERKQFDRPIAGFQMVQDMLAQMQSQVTAMQCTVAQLSQLQDRGEMTDERASLAKVFCTVSCRQVTSMARELMGGNGILISNQVARFLADAEALYSYEGTKQINSLILGRALTGWSAFV